MAALKEFLATQFGLGVVLMALALVVILTAVAYAIWLERKIAAWTQDRFGPNRVGPFGLLQPVADGLKFVLKEDIIPWNVDRAIFILAPCFALIVGLLGFAVIPFGGPLHWPWMPEGQTLRVQVASLDIGLLYILAVGTLAVYSVVLGGWSSNNKYAFYGGLRAAAQMLSYEVPLGMCLLTCVLATGELRLEGMVDRQIATAWTGLLHPAAFVIFFMCALAEANRAPFDLAECEQELIGGYHTEYSAMKMALFFLGEYAHIITSSAVMVALFLGGWELFPFSQRVATAFGWGWLDAWNHSPHWGWMFMRVGVYAVKITALVFFYMWIRWTLPRFRFDQLMRLAWRGLVPLSMGFVALAGTLLYLGRPVSWWASIGNIALVALAGVASANRPITGRQERLLMAKG